MDATSDAPRSPSDDEAPDAGPRVQIVCWTPSGEARTEDVAGLAAMVADPAARIWVDLVDPPFEVIAAVANDLGLHPLIVEDIDEKNQRAKIVEFEDVHIDTLETCISKRLGFTPERKTVRIEAHCDELQRKGVCSQRKL